MALTLLTVMGLATMLMTLINQEQYRTTASAPEDSDTVNARPA